MFIPEVDIQCRTSCGLHFFLDPSFPSGSFTLEFSLGEFSPEFPPFNFRLGVLAASMFQLSARYVYMNIFCGMRKDHWYVESQMCRLLLLNL